MKMWEVVGWALLFVVNIGLALSPSPNRLLDLFSAFAAGIILAVLLDGVVGRS